MTRRPRNMSDVLPVIGRDPGWVDAFGKPVPVGRFDEGCLAPGICMRYSGSVAIRVRWDEPDQAFHCRVIVGGQKVDEVHVGWPFKRAVVWVDPRGQQSPEAYDEAAREAVAQVVSVRGTVDFDDCDIRGENFEDIKIRRTP